jgi:hypothetical protein
VRRRDTVLLGARVGMGCGGLMGFRCVLGRSGRIVGSDCTAAVTVSAAAGAALAVAVRNYPFWINWLVKSVQELHAGACRGRRAYIVPSYLRAVYS